MLFVIFGGICHKINIYNPNLLLTRLHGVIKWEWETIFNTDYWIVLQKNSCLMYLQAFCGVNIQEVVYWTVEWRCIKTDTHIHKYPFIACTNTYTSRCAFLAYFHEAFPEICVCVRDQAWVCVYVYPNTSALLFSGDSFLRMYVDITEWLELYKAVMLLLIME